jgi:hypothetical protein
LKKNTNKYNSKKSKLKENHTSFLTINCFQIPTVKISYSLHTVNILFLTSSQMRIGLIGASSSADWPKFKGVGGVPGSFGVGADGIFHNAGTRVENFMRESFGAGDTIGCGLFYLPWMQDVRFLFFTKNGQQLLCKIHKIILAYAGK